MLNLHSNGQCCYGYVEKNGNWEIPVPTAQLSWKPKPAIKSRVCFQKSEKKNKRTECETDIFELKKSLLKKNCNAINDH